MKLTISRTATESLIRHQAVNAPVAGLRLDAVEFNYTDMTYLMSQRPEVVYKVLTELRLAMRKPA